MILDKKEKQPIEVKDYPIDYTPWLAEVSDTIVSVTATYACIGSVDTALVITRFPFTTTAVVVWLSGGTNLKSYKITVTVTTAGGRVDQSEFIVKIKEY